MVTAHSQTSRRQDMPGRVSPADQELVLTVYDQLAASWTSDRRGPPASTRLAQVDELDGHVQADAGESAALTLTTVRLALAVAMASGLQACGAVALVG